MHRALWKYNADYAHPDEFSLTTFSAPSPLQSRTVQSAVSYVSNAAISWFIQFDKQQLSIWTNLLGNKDRDHTPLDNDHSGDNTPLCEWTYDVATRLPR